MNGIVELISYIFRQVFSWLDSFYLFGKFSLLDFIIACIIVDIVLSALFVTFNVNLGDNKSIKASNK